MVRARVEGAGASGAVCAASVQRLILLLRGLGCLQVLFAMVGKFGSDAAWSTLVVYSSEVLPTSVRSDLSGSLPQVASCNMSLVPTRDVNVQKTL